MNDNEKIARRIGLVREPVLNIKDEHVQDRLVHPDGGHTMVPIGVSPVWANRPDLCATWLLPWLGGRGSFIMTGKAGLYGVTAVKPLLASGLGDTFAEAVTELTLTIIDKEEATE